MQKKCYFSKNAIFPIFLGIALRILAAIAGLLKKFNLCCVNDTL